MTDLNYYQWREKVKVDGQTRLLCPCSDPTVYEAPFDFVFDTKQQAIDFIYSWGYAEESYDPETWVLVHYVGIGIPLKLPELHPACTGWVNEDGSIEHDGDTCPIHEGDSE